jgi:hypothetical protein
VVVHGDAEGAGTVRHALTDWLSAMGLAPAGAAALLDRYVGYWEPYALSHQALDGDGPFQEETRNAARALIEAVTAKRAGMLLQAGWELKSPRQK